MVAILQVPQQQTVPYPQEVLFLSPAGTLSKDLGKVAGQRGLLEESGFFSVGKMVVGICTGDMVVGIGNLVGIL